MIVTLKSLQGANDPRIPRIKQFIAEIVRVRQGVNNLQYVDFGNNLSTAQSATNTIIYGRRGSGKSSLLNEVIRTTSDNVLIHYVDCEDYKNMSYPNLLLKILSSYVSFLNEECMKIGRPTRIWELVTRRRRNEGLMKLLRDLRESIEKPDEADIEWILEQREKSSAGGTLGARVGQVGGSLEKSGEKSEFSGTKYHEAWKKIDYLEKNLDRIKGTLYDAVKKGPHDKALLMLDDFYQIPLELQPLVIDYIHRLCKKGNMFFKCATIRYRSNLYERTKGGSPVGVQAGADIQEIDLDYTLASFNQTQTYLDRVLNRVLAGFELTTENVLGPNALARLVWASGGVPRDMLNILSYALTCLDPQEQRVYKKTVHEASAAYYREKLRELGTDFGNIRGLKDAFERVVRFCLEENQNTAFLIENRAPPVDMPNLNSLVDLRLIHLVSRTVSTKHHSTGRTFSAYILDMGSYAEQLRLRGQRRIHEVDILVCAAGRNDPEDIRNLRETSILRPEILA